MFYAAFELRCCVEARQEQYLDAHADLRPHKKPDYRVQNNRRDIERMFKSDRLASLTFTFRNGVTGRLYYTPVTKQLVNLVGRAGAFLHAKKGRHPPDHPWWTTFREFLNEFHAECAEACSGRLLGPSLLANGMATVKVELLEDVDAAIVSEMSRPGSVFRVAVDYPATRNQAGPDDFDAIPSK